MASVLAWTDCSKPEEERRAGNVLNWETADMRVVDMTEEDIDTMTVCSQEGPKYMAFRTKRNFLESQHLCRTLSGDIAVATGQQAADSIKLALADIEGTEGSIYIDFEGI